VNDWANEKLKFPVVAQSEEAKKESDQLQLVVRPRHPPLAETSTN
jgi:hypothetical protein